MGKGLESEAIMKSSIPHVCQIESPRDELLTLNSLFKSSELTSSELCRQRRRTVIL